MTTITIPRSVVEQALEAMRCGVPTGRITLADWSKALSDLKAALAQGQAEHTDSKYDVEVLREQIRHLEQRIRQLTQDQSAHGKEQRPLIYVGSDGDLTVYGPVCSRHDYLINITTTTTTTNL